MTKSIVSAQPSKPATSTALLDPLSLHLGETVEEAGVKPSVKTRARGHKKKASKPEKPRPDFPLYAHATKRWAKKIRGKTHFFGPWADPDAALRNYVKQRDDLEAGRVPRQKREGLTVRELSDRFLTAKRRAMERGELSVRTFADYFDIARVVVNFVKPERLVLDLVPDDFGNLLDKGYPKSWGPVRRCKAIQITRSLFKFASDEDLIDRVVKVGKQFKGPSKKTLRIHRAKNGKKMFEAHEVRAVIDGALVVGDNGPELVRPSRQLRAMALVACNTGFGNQDVSCLPRSALDLEKGWVNFPRPKTGVQRRAKLWKETVSALRDILDHRPAPATPDAAGLVFLTHRGTSWAKVTLHTDDDGTVRVTEDDAVAKEFAKLLHKLNLKRPGHNFYTLRRVFETVGGCSLDQVAVDFIMGHARDDMASVYRQEIPDVRLEAVSEYVRTWLFSEQNESAGIGWRHEPVAGPVRS
jgi:hypothetical protein